MSYWKGKVGEAHGIQGGSHQDENGNDDVTAFSAHDVAAAYAFLQWFDYGNGLIIIVRCNNY